MIVKKIGMNVSNPIFLVDR